MKKIILATGSPYRRRIFGMLDLDFEAESSDVDEHFDERPEYPGDLVRELARRKARAVAENHEGSVVIGFDSVGYFQGSVLEKPRSKNESRRRLRDMSGESFEFYTGVCVVDADSGDELTRAVKTTAWMREITDREIEKYLEQDEDYDRKAHGFDPLNFYSCTFIERIEGSYFNILQGIPLEAIVEMLPEMGYGLGKSQQKKSL